MNEDDSAGLGLLDSLLFDFKLALHRMRIFLRSAHKHTWIRHIMWPLIRLRLRLFLLDFRFNRGWPVNEFHSWLDIDLDAPPYLSVDEVNKYFMHLYRLRERAHEQDCGNDVRRYLRASHGWLWFAKGRPGW